MKTRIKQFLSSTGRFSSNEEIVNAIKDSKIQINNKVITNPNYCLNPKMDKVTYNNEILRKTRKLYYMLNKPKGYLSSKLTGKDKELRKKSAFELFDNLNLTISEKNSLFFVGRLDEDTEGLIIVTNDGDLSNKITSPNSLIEKEYYCVLENKLTQKDIQKISKGVNIEIEENGEISTYLTKPARIIAKDDYLINIIIHEGKKREIRKIFEALGNKVLNLKRIRIGKLLLGDLKSKQFKEISKDNIY